jgi:lipopolysaccharide/colanic/teichoic acid biosynthesis glycosyltransferase
LTFDERVYTDVHYTQTWSFWMDLYILVRTVPVVVTREGAC